MSWNKATFFFFGSDDLIVLVSVSTGCSFSSTKQIVLRLLTQIWLCTRQHWIWPWPWSLSPLVTVRPPRRVGAYCLSPPRLLSSAEISRSIRQRWLCLRKRTKSDTYVLLQKCSKRKKSIDFLYQKKNALIFLTFSPEKSQKNR